MYHNHDYAVIVSYRIKVQQSHKVHKKGSLYLLVFGVHTQAKNYEGGFT